MPSRASAVTLARGGAVPLVALAVEVPPMEVLGQDGDYLGPAGLVEQCGFVSMDASPTAVSEAGKGWTVECWASTGRTEVRGPNGQPYFSGTIAQLTKDEGQQWLAAATSQGAMPVITGPGVTVDETTGTVELNASQARWLFAPVTVSK